jgi:hypothetical protein
VPTSPESIASMQDVLDTFVKAGIIKTSFDIAPFWTTDFNTDLTKIEGEYSAS